MQRMRKICVAGLFLVVLGFGGCAEIADENGKAGSSVSEDERFEAYTREVFCSEVSANEVSLHYTLKYPQEYGIESAPAVYPQISSHQRFFPQNDSYYSPGTLLSEQSDPVR